MTKTRIDYATSKHDGGKKDRRGNPLLETLYYFYPDGVWDDHKRTLDEANAAYPQTQFVWNKVKP